MCPTRRVMLTLMFAVLGPVVRGADQGAEATLTEKGLERAGWTFVAAEEAPALAQMKRVRSAHAALTPFVEKQAKVREAIAAISVLEQDRVMVQAYLDAVNSGNNHVGGLISGLPPRKSFLLSRATTPLRMDMNAAKDQAKGVLAEIGHQQKVARDEIPSEKDSQALEAEFREKLEAFKVELTALRPLVDVASRKYAELRADESVKEALRAAKKSINARLKLGPSDDFAAGARDLAKFERQLSIKSGSPSPRNKAAKR